MSYTSVFGGNTIYPSDVSYLALALSANNPLEWPLESSGTEDPAARIIDVTPTASGFSVIMPDATQTGAGQTILFNNLSGSYSFYVKDFTGNTLATVGFGEQWQLYLAVTTTAAGTWRVFRYGASTATVQPSALAGFGLTVTGSTLSQSTPVTTFSTTGLTATLSNRAGAFVWNGSGAGTLNLLTAASAGNNYFVMVRNAGGGDLTIDPSGTETINGASTLALHPGDSATVITDGTQWYTVGLGQQSTFAFDYTSISVTGGNYTLAGSELNRIAYKFVGALTSDVYIIIPATVQQYWITNATTGSFNFYVKISGGVATQVTQGAKGIYYCNGSTVILASDPTTLSLPVTVAQGGTGATTASGARLNLGISTFADPIVTATTGASVRTTISAAASGANGDITSLTGLTTALSIAQGGTAATTAAGARTSLGATTVGGNMFTLTNPTAVTFPRFNADNTVSALDAATFRTAIGASGTVSSVGGTGTVNGITLTGTVTSTGSLTLGGTLSGVSLTTQVSGTLPIANGGTNATTAAAARTSLGATTVGGNLFTLTNPTAITFPRFNADNTVSTLDAATFRTAIGAGTSSTTGTVTSVGGTGTVNGITLTGTVTAAGSLTLGGTLSGVSLTTQVSGTLPVANGGTNATTAAGARTSLGSTTVGDNMFTLTNPSAITFPRFNADNTVSALDAASFRTAIGVGTGTGSVTSVAMSVPAFLSIAGSPITTSGTLAVTLSGTALPLANGGTGATTAAGARTAIGSTTVGDNMFTLTNPSAITFPRFNADNTVSALDAASFRTAIGVSTGTGSVTSVAMTVPSFLSVTGSPITTSGTLAVSLSGTALPVANGGTGGTTAAAARTALGAGTGDGTVTSVAGTGSTNGLSLSGTVTTTGNITLGGSVTSVATGATIDGVTIGYRTIPRSTTTTTATTGDVGKVIAVSASITIPNSTFAAGDAVSIYNDSASAISIIAGVTTLRLAGTTSNGTRTLAARGMATIWFNSATEAIISGAGVS